MTFAEGELATRWTESVRADAGANVAAVLERWLGIDGDCLLELERGAGDGARGPELSPGAAFARLGGMACDAGLDLDAVRRLMAALESLLPGAGETVRVAGQERSGATPAMPVLHGIVTGAWHAGCHGTNPATDTRADADASRAATDPEGGKVSGGSSVPGLDPSLAKLIRHDIKTPLQAASLNLELLAMEQEGNPAVTGAIETIMESLDSAVAMLQRFDKA